MRTRITVTALVMLALGGAVMYLSARPLDHEPVDGLSSFSWPIVVVPAVVLGVLFGLVIRVVGHRGTARRGVVVVVVVMALVALFPLSLPLVQLGGSDRTDSNYLIAALSGWVLYHLLSTSIATCGSRPRGLRTAPRWKASRDLRH